VPRLLFAMASFVFAIYIFTGIFGNDLKSISSLIPPQSAQQFRIGSAATTPVVNDPKTWCGPGKHNELFELPHGLVGYFDYADGMKCAAEKNKPVFLDFTGHYCSNCKQMENQVWSDPEILDLLKKEFIIISLYTDDKTKLPEAEWITTGDGKILKTLGEQNVYFELQKFGTFATPWYVLLDPQGNMLNEPRGKDLNIDSYLAFLREGLKAFNEGIKQ
jgi:thiol:disulfide interchange protein DsbD